MNFPNRPRPAHAIPLGVYLTLCSAAGNGNCGLCDVHKSIRAVQLLVADEPWQINLLCPSCYLTFKESAVRAAVMLDLPFTEYEEEQGTLKVRSEIKPYPGMRPSDNAGSN